VADQADSTEACSGSASTSTFADLAAGVDVDEIDDRSALEIVIDALYEKRAATREKALGGMIELLQVYDNCLEVEERQDTVSTLLTNCIRRGGATEQERAVQALGLVYAMLGCCDDSHKIFQERVDILQKVCRSGKSADCRIAGVNALCAGSFITTKDHRETMEVMEFLESIFSSDAEAKKCPDAGTRAAAVRGWALLLTTIPQELVKRQGYRETRLAALSNLLQDNSVELREAAGEGISVLFDAGQDPMSEDANNDRQGATEAAESEDAFSVQLEVVRERMTELAKNLGDTSRRSKKDRSAQKTTFRDVLGVLDGQGVSEVKLKLRHGDTLHADSVCTVAQLNFFRRFLAGGFQDHLQHNPLLHEVFDFQPMHEPGERLSKTERRMFKSPNSAASRARQKHRGAERASAALNRHALLGDAW